MTTPDAIPLPMVRKDASVREVMSAINEGAKGIALVVDDGGHLTATLTDGDIRRAILAGVNMELPVEELLQREDMAASLRPTTAAVGTPDHELVDLMTGKNLRQIPLLGRDEQVVGLAVLSELVADNDRHVRAVVMAGGYGKRLRPMTHATPKPMLKLAQRPVLEHVLEQLRNANIHRVNITTHYKAEEIRNHFGDGKEFGMEISYVHEEEPLGTAGGLKLLDSSDEPLLVVNADVLTELDYRAMRQFHVEHQADATVGLRKYDVEVPFGVVECSGVAVESIREKPVYDFFVNAGIYLLEPRVLKMLPDRPIDMPDVIQALIREGRSVVGFPVLEYWIDIGNPESLTRARQDLKKEGE